MSKKCPKCHRKYSEGTYCVDCGCKLETVISIHEDIHNYKMRKTPTALYLGIAAIIIAAIAIIFLTSSGRYSSKVEIVKDTIEAGETMDLMECVKIKDEDQNRYSLILADDYDTANMKTGKSTITYILTDKEADTSKNIDVDITIKDTKCPEIKQIKKKLAYGKELDIDKYVKVEDKYDGKMSKKNLKVSGSLDSKKPGVYSLTVSATDKTGNETSKEIKIKVLEKNEINQKDYLKFMNKTKGLWLNGCQSAKKAKEIAKFTGITDVSMTQFVRKGNYYYMTTLGDIKGEFDGDTVPDIRDKKVVLTSISKDFKTANGTVDKKKIFIDLKNIDKQVIFYKCAGYYTHGAYTGFASESSMNSYLMK